MGTRTEMPIMIDQLLRRKHPDAPHVIPMSCLNEKWADRNHGQTLERLAQRGGLGPCEALAIMDGRPWRKMDQAQAIAELKERTQGPPSWHRLAVDAQVRCLYQSLRDMSIEAPRYEMTEQETELFALLGRHPASRKTS